MNLRKISIILIIAVTILFIVGLVVYDKNKSGVAKAMDVGFALALWTFAMSYLPLEKKRAPYIKGSVVISFFAVILLILVIAGVDFHLGESL